MHLKSDIESILESQTWKLPSPKQGKSSKTSKSPEPLITAKLIKSQIKLKPLEKFSLKVPQSETEAPKANPTNSQRKSILAIPLASMVSRMSEIISDEELNVFKIPTFPKYPFGDHKGMLSQSPTFENLPKESVHNFDSIKAIKIESGRIKRSIAQGLSTSIFKIKKKFRKLRNHKISFDL